MGALCRVRGVFEEAKAAGLQPSIIMYTTLVDAYGGAGQLQAASAVLADMQAAGVAPTVWTYACMMRWYGHRLCPARALSASGSAPEYLKASAGVQNEHPTNSVLRRSGMEKPGMPKQCWTC